MDEPQTAPEVVGPARLSRRQALRLLGAALLAGACGAPARTARRAAGPGSRPSATIATTTTRLPAPPATATTTATGPADPTTTTQPPEPPAPQAEDVRVGPLAGFVAFGDFGGGPAQRAVAQAMLAGWRPATASTPS